MELQLEYEKKLKNLKKPQITLKQIFELYYEKVGQFTKSKTYIKWLDCYYRDLTHFSIHDLTPKLITENRERRLKFVKPGTLHKEMSLGSSVFTFTVHEVFLIQSTKKPTKPQSRQNRINQAQIDRFLFGLDHYNENMISSTPAYYIVWTFLFVLETAVHKGEILEIRKEHSHDDYVHLPETKNGTTREMCLYVAIRS